MSRLLCHGDDSRKWCQVLFVFQLRRRKRRRRKSLRSPMTTWDSAFSIKLLELINKVFTKSLLCSFSLYFKTCVCWPDRAYSFFGYVILFSLMEKKTLKRLADEIEPSAQWMALWSLWALKQTTPDPSFLGFCSAVWIIHELRRRYPHLTPVRLTLKLLTARDKVSRDGELLPARLKLHVVLCVSSSEPPRGKSKVAKKKY